MLSGKMYTDEYIRELQNRAGNDPALLERVVYAFPESGTTFWAVNSAERSQEFMRAECCILRLPYSLARKQS